MHGKTPLPLFYLSCRPQPATLLKKRLWHRYSPMNFAKFHGKRFFREHLLETAQQDIVEKDLKTISITLKTFYLFRELILKHYLCIFEKSSRIKFVRKVKNKTSLNTSQWLKATVMQIQITHQVYNLTEKNLPYMKH